MVKKLNLATALIISIQNLNADLERTAEISKFCMDALNENPPTRHYGTLRKCEPWQKRKKGRS